MVRLLAAIAITVSVISCLSPVIVAADGAADLVQQADQKRNAAPPAQAVTARPMLTVSQQLAMYCAQDEMVQYIQVQRDPLSHEALRLAVSIRDHLGPLLEGGACAHPDPWRAAGAFAVLTNDAELAAWATEALLRLVGDVWDEDVQLTALLPPLNALAKPVRVAWIQEERAYVASLEADKRATDVRARRFAESFWAKPVVNSIGMTLVRIDPGEFVMGSPVNEKERDADETQHRVKLTRPFYMATTEVTQAQWKAVMGDNPSWNKGDNLPVDNPHPLPAGTFPLLRGKKYHRGPLVDRLRQVPRLGVASTMKNPSRVGGRGTWEGAVTPTMPRIQQHANVNGDGELPIT